MDVEIGKYNQLNVIKESDAGVYLDASDLGELLLPKVEVPIDIKLGSTLEVFLYLNSKAEVVPTTRKPYGCVNEFACLKVVAVSNIGAFLDWGLPKDLFVPIGEQHIVMKEGRSYIVYIYYDLKRNRLAASSKLEHYLNKTPAGYVENQEVKLLIAHETELGFNAIMDNAHWGLLYKDEVFTPLEYGQRATGYIKKMRPDEKIDLRLEPPGYQPLDNLEAKIIAQLNQNGGTLALTDKSPPESIYQMFGVSKKKYKMALGSLYKNKRIVIGDEGIKNMGTRT